MAGFMSTQDKVVHRVPIKVIVHRIAKVRPSSLLTSVRILSVFLLVYKMCRFISNLTLIITL